MRTSTPLASADRSFVEWLVIAPEMIIGVMAALCGPLLIATDGLGMERSELDATPFPSFVIPGIVLAIVGIGLVIAGMALLKRRAWGVDASLLAGDVLLGWIVFETYWIQAGRGLQIVVAAAALLIMLGSLRLRQSKPMR